MSVLTLRTDRPSVEDIMNTIAYAFGNKRPETAPPKIASLLKIRKNKITRIRQQLAHGTYDLDERLDPVLERILMDIKP